MESNKLLIGITFYYSRKITKEDGSVTTRLDEYVQEFIVPRDATLRQLLEGVQYGFLKRIKEYVNAGGDQRSDEYKREMTCLRCCMDCMNKIVDNTYPWITITSFDASVDGLIFKNGRVQITRDHESKKLYELGFLSSTRLVFDNTERFESFAVVENTDAGRITAAFRKGNGAPELVFPKFNISNRQLYQFNTEPVEIIPPAQVPQKPKNTLLLSILPSLIMAFSMIMMRSFTSSGENNAGMIGMYVVMAAAGIISSIIMFLFQRRDHKKELAKWRINYQNYIDRVCANIEDRQRIDRNQLERLYPEIHTIVESINGTEDDPFINGRVFSRVANDEDFLKIKLGISDEVETMFEIKGEKKDEIISEETFQITDQIEGVAQKTRVLLHFPDDPDYQQNVDINAYLTNLPHAIAQRYRYMKHSSLLFSLQKSSCLGVVADKTHISDAFISKMLFDICYYHSPEEVQIVVLFPQTNQYDQIEKQIKKYKFLPHFRELFNDKSQFVFDSESANLVFGSTYNILSQRVGAEASKPHIVFVVYDEYSLKEHALASFLPKVPEEEEKQKNSLSISFVFIKRYREHLPSYCTDVIRLGQDYSSITPREDENKMKVFDWWETWTRSGNGTIDDLAYNAYKLLSGLVYSRMTQNGKVPSGISFFEMCGIKAGDMHIIENWGYKTDYSAERKGESKVRKYDITKSLKVPIGRTELGVTYLDLHEDADGPHMLVAGTTGSGKSETIISYLLSLCLCFTPEELSLMLVDMKGGGFIKRIGDLPHVVGTVTDVDGDESGTGDEYMVRRFLDSLKCEIKRRKLLLNQMHVDSADKYIAACRDIESHIRTLSNDQQSVQDGKTVPEIPDADVLRDLAKHKKLSHLVLVVDEFTELKRFTSESEDVDFIGEITTIARVGRSLGFHIILVSQNIESAITDDIRVNSRARLCLKVATKQASKEMIGSELAASPTMPGHGRAYLLVGTGSKFEYFQSAYTGTSIVDSMDVPFEIIRAEKTGKYSSFYQSDKDNIQQNKKRNELKKSGAMKTQCTAIVNEIKETFAHGELSLSKPHIIFQPPLPKKVTLKNGKRYDIK